MVFGRQAGQGHDVDISIDIRTDRQQLQRTQREVENFDKTLKRLFDPEGFKIKLAQAQLSNFRDEIRQTSKATAEADQVTERWIRTLRGMERQTALDKIARDLSKIKPDAADFEQQLARINDRLREMGAQSEEIDRVFARASGGGAGAGRNVLGALGTELRALPAIPIPGTGISTETPARLLQSLGRLDIGMRELAIGGGLAAAAIVGVQLALDNFQRTLEPTRKLIRGIVEAQQEVAGLLAKDDPQLIVDSYEAAIETLNELEAKRTKALEQEAIIRENLENQQAGLGHQLARAFGGLLGEFLVQNEIQQPLRDIQEDIDDYNAQIAAQQVIVSETERELEDANRKLTEQREREIASTRRLAALQAQLAVEGMDAEAIRNRIAAIEHETRVTREAISSGELTTEAVDRLWERVRQLGEEFNVLTAALPGAEAIEAFEEHEKRRQEAEAQLVAAGERALAIQEQGEARRTQIIEQGAKQVEAAEKRLSDARQKLADFDAETAEKRADVDSDFMQRDLERLEDFKRKETRILRDAERDRLRALEDHQQRLLDAEMNNNVAAFLAEQRQFATQQRRREEDQRTALGDRLEDLERERQKAREVREERIADLDRIADKRREALVAEIAERETALAAVKADIQARLQAERDAVQRALKTLVDSWDDSTETMVRKAIEGWDIIEGAGLNMANAVAARMDDWVQQMRTHWTPHLSAGVQSVSQSIARVTNAPGFRPTAFATGGRVTQPTLAVMGERPGWDDWVFPVKRSEGIEAALARAGAKTNEGILFNFAGASFGNLTRQDVEGIVQRELVPVVRGQMRGISMVRNGG